MADVTDVCACVFVCVRVCAVGGSRRCRCILRVCECRGSYMVDAFSCGSCFSIHAYVSERLHGTRWGHAREKSCRPRVQDHIFLVLFIKTYTPPFGLTNLLRSILISGRLWTGELLSDRLAGAIKDSSRNLRIKRRTKYEWAECVLGETEGGGSGEGQQE